MTKKRFLTLKERMSILAAMMDIQPEIPSLTPSAIADIVKQRTGIVVNHKQLAATCEAGGVEYNPLKRLNGFSSGNLNVKMTALQAEVETLTSLVTELDTRMRALEPLYPTEYPTEADLER